MCVYVCYSHKHYQLSKSNHFCLVKEFRGHQDTHWRKKQRHHFSYLIRCQKNSLKAFFSFDSNNERM